MRTKALLVLALALVALAGPALADPKTKIKGKGLDEDRNGFVFAYSDADGGAGQVAFVTNSFGTITGAIDCIDTDGALVMMAGAIDVPTGGLTHFLVVAEDGKATRSADQITSWLRSGPFDCLLAGDDADLADSREPIRRGKVVVKVPLHP